MILISEAFSTYWENNELGRFGDNELSSGSVKCEVRLSLCKWKQNTGDCVHGGSIKEKGQTTEEPLKTTQKYHCEPHWL